MQSIFRLPWCSEPLGGEKQDVALQKMRPSSIDMPVINKLKRRRSNSPGFLPDVKRKRPCEKDVSLLKKQESQAPRQVLAEEVNTAPSNKNETSEFITQRKMDDGAPLTALIPSDLSPLQQTIEQEFNLEILLKHRELRTIEQELAKCMVALEQLRRCEIIPYPGQDLSTNTSAGTGPALRATPGFSQPAAPAPWGVTDGPYSKHYSTWLLPDPTFDSVSAIHTPAHDPYATIRGDRSTRNTGASWAKPVKSRHNRDSVSFSAQTPVVQAPPRNKGGPLVLKRMSDNQFVKLVCTKCHRSDFSSVQGFLNHCRIAHKIDYKSHEAAAQDCGHLLEDHEADLAASAPPPVGSTVRTPAPKATVPPPVPVTTTKVHALNQEFIPRPTWKRQRLAYIQDINTKPTPVVAPAPTRATVISSAAAPFLSAHLAKRGVGVNLAAIIAKLGEKIDLGPEPIDEVEDSQGTDIPEEAMSGARTLSGKLDRPGSRKGFHQAGNRPRPAPLATPLVNSSLSSAEIPESPQHVLSPHTADSNPGLVSDHEDDLVSDSEETGSVIATAETIRIHAGCGDAMDLDVQVDDDHDGHGVIIRSRGSMQDDPAIREAGSPSRSRSKFGRREK